MRKFTSYKIGLLAAAAMGLSAMAAPAFAQNEPVAITASTPVEAAKEGVSFLGAARADAPVKFQIALKLRDYKGLMASNAKGRVMSPAEMAAKHLPTKADYDKVLNWAVDSGLTVSRTTKSRMSVELKGNVAVVSRVLGVSFQNVRSEGRDYVASLSTPSLPAHLAASVQSVNGLLPYQHAFKQSVHMDGGDMHTASATNPPLYAQAFITGYGATGLGLAGKGATTAILIDVFPRVDDLKNYYTRIGSVQRVKNITMINTTGDTMGGPSGEESMDVEVSSAIAPKSKVRVYAPGNLSFADLDTSMDAMIDDMNDGVKITQVSISLGACERKVAKGIKNTDDNKFAVMSGLGASIFVSTGDHGSRECGKQTTSFYATSPNVTGAGGTSLSLNGDGTVNQESGWSGSGGGVSSYFATPTYQSDLGFDHRTIPDLSADANPGTGALVIYNNADHQIGGTSLSAPILAGLVALANADRIKHRKDPVGLLNGRIYGLPADNFRDITAGNNSDYDAAEGYDLVTGIGAPKMDVLIPTLRAQD